jgi:hypothetical protein
LSLCAQLPQPAAGGGGCHCSRPLLALVHRSPKRRRPVLVLAHSGVKLTDEHFQTSLPPQLPPLHHNDSRLFCPVPLQSVVEAFLTLAIINNSSSSSRLRSLQVGTEETRPAAFVVSVGLLFAAACARRTCIAPTRPLHRKHKHVPCPEAFAVPQYTCVHTHSTLQAQASMG